MILRPGRLRLRNRFAAVIALLALAVGANGGQHSGEGTGEPNPAVDALFAGWDAPGAPGCALAVAKRGELVYSRGYGHANLDYDLPITPWTVFDVASITKQFVAAALGMLVLEGKLSLDDDVRRWLPELPAYESPVTLSHMLYHTSGLRDYLNLFPLAGRDDYFPISHAQILAMMARQRDLNFPPGERYSYSNTAYMLLAQVIERAAGRSLKAVTTERIFEPLGMNSSLMYENREDVIPRRATGYGRDGNGRPRIVHNYNFDVAGDGQLYTTVEDLLRWDEYLHGADQPAIHTMMLTEGRLNNGDPIGYGQGIRLDEYRGLRTVGHSGSSWGFRSQLVRFVEPGLSIAVACNADFARPGELALRVADHFLAGRLGPAAPDTDKRSDSPSPKISERISEQSGEQSRELARFAGTYFSPELDASYRFAVVDGGLAVRIEQEPAIRVTPVAGNRFAFELAPPGWSEPALVELEFQQDGAGAVTGFSLSAGDEQGIVFERP